ncbi:hypothetical protein GCM10019059_03440 [Camelimonas fluminis]|nr:hypothetical protein GCM10019059_03440 [Camelimonas fluminis]
MDIIYNISRSNMDLNPKYPPTHTSGWLRKGAAVRVRGKHAAASAWNAFSTLHDITPRIANARPLLGHGAPLLRPERKTAPSRPSPAPLSFLALAIIARLR